jgi:membrane protein
MIAQVSRWVGRVLGWWQRTTPGRVWTRYGRTRAALLAGGIAYAGFFSMFPALALAFTVLGVVADFSVDLRQRMADAVNSTFSTEVIGPTGLTTVADLTQVKVLTLFGVVGLVLLAVTGLGWVATTREGIRAVFSLNGGTNLVVDKLVDIGALLLLGSAVLASMAATVALTLISGSGASRFVLQLLVDLALIGFDSVIFLLLFRWLGRVPRTVGQLYPAALAGAIGIFALKLAGTFVVRWASGNKFLASVTVVVGLLLWFNLVARLTLLCAAWAATTTEAPAVVDYDPVTPVPVPASRLSRPSAADRDRQALLDAGFDVPPVISARAQDRVTLAAGAVLGAGAVAVAGLLRRAVVSALPGRRG